MVDTHEILKHVEDMNLVDLDVQSVDRRDARERRCKHDFYANGSASRNPSLHQRPLRRRYHQAPMMTTWS